MREKDRRRASGRRAAGAAAGSASAGEDPFSKDPRARALRDRGETAIKSFLVFAFGAIFLLAFAKCLRDLQPLWPSRFGSLADPMEKILSLTDPKPVFAVQALALLLRGFGLLTNKWRENELVTDTLDALYAVTFSLLGFLVGAGLFLLLTRFETAPVLEALALLVVSAVLLVGLDLTELRMTPFLGSALYRLALAVIYFLFAAVVLFTNA